MPRSNFIPTGSDHESSDHDLSPEVKNQSPEVKKSIPEVMPSSEVQPEFRPVLPSRSSIRRSGVTSRDSLVSSRKSLASSSDGASTDSFHDYPSSSTKYYSTSAKVVWIFFACWPVRPCPSSLTSAPTFGLGWSMEMTDGIIQTAGDASADSLEAVTFLIIGDFDQKLRILIQDQFYFRWLKICKNWPKTWAPSVLWAA